MVLRTGSWGKKLPTPALGAPTVLGFVFGSVIHLEWSFLFGARASSSFIQQISRNDWIVGPSGRLKDAAKNTSICPSGERPCVPPAPCSPGPGVWAENWRRMSLLPRPLRGQRSWRTGVVFNSYGFPRSYKPLRVWGFLIIQLPSSVFPGPASPLQMGITAWQRLSHQRQEAPRQLRSCAFSQRLPLLQPFIRWRHLLPPVPTGRRGGCLAKANH